jgi:hypothetical protein
MAASHPKDGPVGSHHVDQGLSRARRVDDRRILDGVITNAGKEIQMSDTQGAAQGDGEGGRRLNTFWMVVLWVVVIVLAVAPYPWW